MDSLACQLATDECTVAGAPEFELAPRPRTLADTGLDALFLAELVAKHLHDGGVLTLAQLAQRVALTGGILEGVLNFLRREGRIEVLGGIEETSAALRYTLTDRGRAWAFDALLKNGYFGPAPVPLAQYRTVIAAQSIHTLSITRPAFIRAFHDVVIDENLIDQLGPASQSGRAIFVYGPAGTGKTYITQRLVRVFHDSILIPYALVVNGAVIRFFDPAQHVTLQDAEVPPGLLLDDGHDPRYLRCHRPVVTTGGELTLDMLEVHYDTDTRQYYAPLQMKATNGIFIIDDLGRQRVAPADLLNRWIVPMEERKDFYSLAAGRHFSLPFDVLLVFSTNIDPLQLADEAFLRRIGYKIRFDYLNKETYQAIWRQVCTQQSIAFDPEILTYVLEQLHTKHGVALLPCHPRDLIGLALDQCRYLGEERRLTQERMRWAWDNYFVRLESADLAEIRAH